MCWRDDAQRAAVCSTLLALVGLGGLWRHDFGYPGPTRRAHALLEAGGAPLSSGERVMLRLAWDVWNGAGRAVLGETLAVLSPRLLEKVGRLLMACAQGPDQIDAWIQEVMP